MSTQGTLRAIALAMSVAACAAKSEYTHDIHGATSPNSGVVLVVTDKAGQPIRGAKVYWAAPGYPLFPCDASARPLQGGYTWSGEATTDSKGKVYLHVRGARADQRYQVQVVGTNGERTLSSLGADESAKTVLLLPVVRMGLSLRCGGGTCGEIEGQGRVVRDGGICEFYVPRGVHEQVELAVLPQGDLELRLHTNEGTPSEGLNIYRHSLASDLQTTIDTPIRGGHHELAGNVLFPDRSPPGGKPYFTTVHLECSNGLTRHVNPEPSTGAFRITALPTVPCTISAAHSGSRKGYWQATPTRVSPGSATTLRIVLQQTSSD